MILLSTSSLHPALRHSRSLTPAFLLMLAMAMQPAALARSHSGKLGTFAGAYADSAEPDTPLSFYSQKGALVMESERQMPTVLHAISGAAFRSDENDVYRFEHQPAGWVQG